MTETKTQSKTTVKLKYPKRYKVILHNDDVTPMEFVISLLIEIFNKNLTEAKEITMQIHHEGKGVAGIYSHEIAEQKVHEAQIVCSYNKHPLKMHYEEI